MAQSTRSTHRTSLAGILNARGLTERDMADLTGIGQSQFNRIKNGRVCPTVATALRITTVLGITVEEAFGAAWRPGSNG